MNILYKFTYNLAIIINMPSNDTSSAQATDNGLDSNHWAELANQFPLKLLGLLPTAERAYDLISKLLNLVPSIVGYFTARKLQQLQIAKTKQEINHEGMAMKPTTITPTEIQAPQPVALPTIIAEAIAQRIAAAKGSIQVNTEVDAAGAGTVVQDVSAASNKPTEAATQYNHKVSLKDGATGQRNNF